MQIGRRVALITGTSSGIGNAIATRLREDGWRVYGGGRRTDPADPDAVRLDVINDRSMRTAVATVLDRAGRIDAVINNVGVDTAGAAPGPVSEST